MGLFNATTEYIGLDVGSTAIRFVQLRKGSGNPALLSYGSIPMPAGLAASDAPADQTKIAELIQKLLKDSGIVAKSAVVGLPSSKIFTSVITTPKLDDAQLAKAIKYQAEQYIPMAMDQVKLDYSVIGQSPDGANVDVLLVAAPVSTVTKYANVLDLCAIEPLALEANAVAAGRALVTSKDIAVVILDISSFDSDITIIDADVPRLMRSVAVGGTTFVKAVAQNLGLDEIQAEQFTSKFGLTQTKLEGQVYKAIKPSLDSLVSEIEKSITFYKSTRPEAKLEKLVITGTAVGLPELAPYLATATGMPVEFGNAWAGVSYPSASQDQLMAVSSQYAAAVGLALRMYR
jgi:type IV pilus assembly protein PilM